MSRATLRKAYQKELALELRGKKRRNKRGETEDLMQLMAAAAARNAQSNNTNY